MTNDALAAAFHATTYRIYLPHGAIDLRIGEANPQLREWLAEQGSEAWAVMTAHNPASEQLTAEENAARQSRLECDLLERGCDPFAGENISDDGSWPVEDSCLVTGLSLADYVELAATCGQSAIVCGEADAVPCLIWLDR